MRSKAVSHYMIVEKLGEGDVGVACRARDTRLSRFATIRSVPPARVADPDLRAWFVCEAPAAPALNQHKIVTIHDIDSHDRVGASSSSWNTSSGNAWRGRSKREPCRCRI